MVMDRNLFIGPIMHSYDLHPLILEFEFVCLGKTFSGSCAEMLTTPKSRNIVKEIILLPNSMPLLSRTFA